MEVRTTVSHFKLILRFGQAVLSLPLAGLPLPPLGKAGPALPSLVPLSPLPRHALRLCRPPLVGRAPPPSGGGPCP